MNNQQSMIPSMIPVATTPVNLNNKYLTNSESVSNMISQNQLKTLSTSVQNRKSESLVSPTKHIALEQMKNEEKYQGLKQFSCTSKENIEQITKIQQQKQQPTYTSSSNFKIKIYHSSNDLVNIDKTNGNISNNDKSSFSFHASQNQKRSQSKFLKWNSVSKSIVESALKDRACSERDLSKTYEISKLNDTFQSKKLDDIHPQRHQLKKQLKEKEFSITEISKLIIDKDQLIENLHYEINDKNKRIFELQDEIKKRKYDMNEMSRRIIELNRELKTCKCRKNVFNDHNGEWRPLSRSLSRLSLDSLNCSDDKNNGNNRWLKIRLKNLKKMIPKKNCNEKSTTTGDCIKELKSILQEKEMLITELRLETKITNHKLLELENTLKKRDEESFVIKRNNEYFEKLFKSKLID